MTPEQFEAETIVRANEGDVDAGIEAIRLCAAGLYAGQLSESLRFYLADCLYNIAEGVPAAQALRVEKKRSRGRPSEPFPAWEEGLAAFAAILKLRGYRPERINVAMTEARDIDRKDAQRIRKTYSPMQQISEERLLRLCNSRMRDLLGKFPPQT